MIPQWFIEAKRDGKAHPQADLAEWVRGITDGSLPDYQISAWLMAVYLNGMTDEEIAILTDAMLHSGETIQFPFCVIPVRIATCSGVRRTTLPEEFVEFFIKRVPFGIFFLLF